MKPSKTGINTFTTLQKSEIDITSSKQIIPSAFHISPNIQQKRLPERIVSNLEIHSKKTINVTRQIQQTAQHKKNFNKNKAIIKSNFFETSNTKLVNVLQKIFFKKKRYCFQVLKQFYLFPDQSQSSINSLSTYDPLIFTEEIIHSLVKIMQTQLIQNKIWAFLNLKMMPYLKAAVKIQQKVTKIQQKAIRVQKKVSFDLIKKASYDAISIIKQSRFLNVNSYFDTQNKQIQCKFQDKKQRKSYLSSNLVQQQVRPMIRIKSPEVNEVQSTTRVYTREQYEKKYGKMRQNNENTQPKVIRISSPDYKRQVSNSRMQQLEYRNSSRKQQKQTYERVQTSPRQSKSIRKYNIIHYHERPRQIKQTVSFVNQKNHNCSTNVCLSCCVSCCCCVNQCEINYCVKSRCNSRCYDKCDSCNQTAVTNKVKIINGPKSTFNSYQVKQNTNSQLSQLQSRIQYLNFLRNLVKEQQDQSSL